MYIYTFLHQMRSIKYVDELEFFQLTKLSPVALGIAQEFFQLLVEQLYNEVLWPGAIWNLSWLKAMKNSAGEVEKNSNAKKSHGLFLK